jgi:predicted RNA binding protein YcfA (HicA-like mRNA interferase family)
MKLPREVSGKELVRALERIGYRQIRQKGSHVTLVARSPNEHHIVVPLHNPLKLECLQELLPMLLAIVRLRKKSWWENCLDEFSRQKVSYSYIILHNPCGVLRQFTATTLIPENRTRRRWPMFRGLYIAHSKQL